MDWRIKTFLTNKLPPDKTLRIIDFIFECFEEPTLKILLILSIISLIIGLLKEGLKTSWIRFFFFLLDYSAFENEINPFIINISTHYNTTITSIC